MSLDLQVLGGKLTRYRKQFQATISDVEIGTGISSEVLLKYEQGLLEPTGDHILIFADFYHCDYKFFISNEKLAPFDQTETLFRMHGSELSKEDRWSIQEFLFLCECEEMLLKEIPKINRSTFNFTKRGDYFKGHGADAAKALRRHIGHSQNAVGMNIYDEFRSIGLHVFRRILTNSKISGLFIRHPTAGACVLINYSEDIYRQRFTAAHETGHAILDDDKDLNVSFESWDNNDLSEIRANTFASHFLMPPEFLKAIPKSDEWNKAKSLDWANRMKVSTTALANALLKEKLISASGAASIKSVRVPFDDKEDPELPRTMSQGIRDRKTEMLKKGLSSFYVDLCFDGYDQGTISAGRLAEILLTSTTDLHSIADMYGRSLSYGD